MLQKKYILSLASVMVLGYGLASINQEVKANDYNEVNPFNTLMWEGYQYNTDVTTGSITFMRANDGKNPKFPNVVDPNTSWDGLTPKDIKHLSFKQRVGSKDLRDINNYVQFFDNTQGFPNFMKQFPHLETIDGLEYVFLDGTIDSAIYTNFFSGLENVTFLDVSNLIILNPRSYTFTGFLQNLPNLEVLFLSSDAPSFKTGTTEYHRYTWLYGDREAKSVENALDFNNGKESKIREFTFNSARTPLWGIQGTKTGLKLSSSHKWIQLTAPQHLGGIPLNIGTKEQPKYNFMNSDDFLKHDTQGKQETWAFDVWDIEHGGQFKPLDPGDPLPDEQLKESKATSDIRVNLNVIDTTIPDRPQVIDPNNPGGDLEEVAPDAPGSHGNGSNQFYLNWVSDLYFKGELTGENLTLFAEKINVPLANGSSFTSYPFAQVTSKNEHNWNVDLKLSEIKSEKQDFKGELTLLGGKSSLSSKNETPTQTPVVKQVTFTPNESQTVITAKDVEYGVWSSVFEVGNQSSFQLNVPKNTQHGSYKGTLTWVLTTTP